MKMAQGYVTEDGTFYESKLEATLHEAEAGLRVGLATLNPGIDANGFLTIVFELRPQIKDYIDAYNAAYPPKHNQQAEEQDRATAEHSGTTKADGSIGHVSSTEEDLASLLKLPPRGPSHVSDVGSSPRTKKVQDRRAKHGA